VRPGLQQAAKCGSVLHAPTQTCALGARSVHICGVSKPFAFTFVVALLGACAQPRPPASVERPPEEDLAPTPTPPPDKSNLIRVHSPAPGALARSPLRVTGEARGTWYFEATFPITLYDEQRRPLVQSYATAQGEWMTEDFVPFVADLVFAAGDAQEGTLVIEKANPAGSIEGADQVAIPVRLAPKKKR
jgi:hypothetical protein